MILRVYTVMVWGGLVEVWGGLGCFNGPRDGYANSYNVSENHSRET